jgi:glycosyltransferase involved in cell wall biosynthesis
VLLTFVGRLAQIKRVDVLLRAVAVAHRTGAGVRLAIVGDGQLRTNLERLTAELGLTGHVHFVGYRADVASVAAASDIGVLSSDNEGTPVSLIEAAAAGRPSVATAVGGVPAVVTAETGLLVSAGDADGLGRAMAELALDPARRGRMGEAARHHVAERFSVDRLVHDIDRLYGELLSPRSRSESAGSRG